MVRMSEISRRRFIQSTVLATAAVSLRDVAFAQTTIETAWQKILEAGRKEGKVLMYGGVFAASHVKPVAEAFKKASGIDFDFLPVTGPIALTRIQEEAKVGRAPDIFEAGGGWLTQLNSAGMLVPLKDKALPVFSEPEASWRIHPGYKNPTWNYVLGRLRIRQGHLGVNTKLLPEKDFPTSWSDLAANPKFKGTLVLPDPSRTAVAGEDLIMHGYVGKAIKPSEMWRVFAAQNTMLVSVPRANVNAVAQGERALTFPPIDETVINLVKAGAPVKNIYFPNTPIYAGTGDMGVIKSGAHPNAAMVFINWYLGKEGQQFIGDLLLQTSVRRDVRSTVPEALRGQVVGGGTRGPVIIDTPMQAELMHGLIASGIMKKVVDGSSVEDFEKAYNAYVKDWEAKHGVHSTPNEIEFS